MRCLDHADIVALSELFYDWAFNEPKLDADQRTQVLLWSIDYETIADYCGAGWQASDPGEEEDAIQFIAKQCRASRG